jgi:hypothetical protein
MSEIEVVVEQFPELAEEIRKYYREDAEFHEICQDYLEASQVYGKMTVRGGECTDKSIEDYRNLLAELKEELLQTLNELEVQGGTTGDAKSILTQESGKGAIDDNRAKYR